MGEQTSKRAEGQDPRSIPETQGKYHSLISLVSSASTNDLGRLLIQKHTLNKLLRTVPHTYTKVDKSG